VKRGWEISGYSLSGLEMRWAAIWTVTQVSWQLWIMPLRAMDGFSGKYTYKYEFLDLKPDPAAGVSGSCAVSG
jgi:hypothetical protein